MKLSATSTSITAKGFVATSGYTPSVPDTTAPTLTINTSTNSLDANETATITFNWSEIVIGFGDGDITTTGGTLSAISGSGATYTAVFTPTAQSTTDGVITVGANVVVDGASNANTSGDTLTMTVNTVVDVTAPTLTITTDDSSLSIGETAAVTFTWSETVTGFADADITTTGGTLSTISGSGTTYTATFTPTASSTTNGVITVGANAVTDSSGNANSVGDTLTMTVDTNASATAQLTFRYHMYGSDMRSYYVYWETISGGTVGHTQLWFAVGQQHTSPTDQWDLATVDMTSFRGTTGRLKVVAKIPPSTGYKNDAAFCRFVITRSDASGSTNWMYSNSNGGVRTHPSSSAVISNSPTAALTISTPTILNGSNNSNAQWSSKGGSTPSANTGPDKHYNDGTVNTYLYFEGSGASSTYNKVYLAENVNTITI